MAWRVQGSATRRTHHKRISNATCGKALHGTMAHGRPSDKLWVEPRYLEAAPGIGRQLPEYVSAGLGHAPWPAAGSFRPGIPSPRGLRRPPGIGRRRHRHCALVRVDAAGSGDHSRRRHRVSRRGAQHPADLPPSGGADSHPCPGLQLAHQRRTGARHSRAPLRRGAANHFPRSGARRHAADRRRGADHRRPGAASRSGFPALACLRSWGGVGGNDRAADGLRRLGGAQRVR